MGTPAVSSEVFILLALRVGIFVRVGDTGFTDALLAEDCEIWKIAIDSIGITKLSLRKSWKCGF